jgi:hypothetical protein
MRTTTRTIVGQGQLFVDLVQHDDLLLGGLVVGNNLGFTFFIVFFTSFSLFINIHGSPLPCFCHLTRTRLNDTNGWMDLRLAG